MNLVEQYKASVRYEDIKPDDKLIITDIIEYPDLDKIYRLSIGDIVTVDSIEICLPHDIESCRNCPCRGVCICIVNKHKHFYGGSSCWYKFKTEDGRPVI